MFATLDPTIRAIRLPSRRRVLLSDTVGFLRDLPPDLIAAFRATLEEAQEAALILQVTDVSNPNHASQDAEVLKVLTDLGIQDRPRLHVLNKADLLAKEDLEILKKSNGHREQRILTSAVTGDGLQDLLARMDAVMPVDPLVRVRLRIPVSDGRHLSIVNSCGRILDSRLDDGYFAIEAELPESFARRLEEFILSPSATSLPAFPVRT
jgi:GTP-binding protein HflX